MNNKLLRSFLVGFVIALTEIVGVAQSQPLEINTKLHKHFRFVAYGDTRFTDPANTKDANPEVRQELVRAIAKAHPDFISDSPFEVAPSQRFNVER